MNLVNLKFRTFALLFAIHIALGCGGGGGGGSSDADSTATQAPSIYDLSYTPASAVLNSGGGTVQIDVQFSFDDPGCIISTITLKAFDMLGVQIDSATVPVGGPSVSAGTISFSIDADTSESGIYFIEMYVSGSGLSSNTLSCSYLVSIPIASPVADADSNENNPGRPSIGYDGTNYLVVYRKLPAGTLHGTLISGAGAVLSSFQISDVEGLWWNNVQTCVAFDGTNYLVVFSNNNGLWGQRVSTSGVALDGATGFQIAGTSNWNPAIAFDGVNYIVVYEKFVNLPDNPYDIYGIRISPAGAMSGEIAISTRSGYQVNPAISFDGTNYFVVWEDRPAGSTSENFHIYGSRIKNDGTVLDPAGIPIVTATGPQEYPEIAFDGTNYLAVWLNWPIPCLYGKRISQGGILLDGTASEPGIAINSFPSTSKAYPAMIFDGTKYFIVWSYSTKSVYPPAGIYGAKVSVSGILDGVPDAAGIPLSGPPPKSTNSKYTYPAVLKNGTNILVVWLNNAELGGTSKEIIGILVSP